MPKSLDESKLSKLQVVFLHSLRTWLEKREGIGWTIEPYRSGRGYTVELKPRMPGSVPVVACVERSQILIFIEDIEHVFTPARESPEEASQKLIHFLEGALSGKVKIVIKMASGKPYKKSSYVYQDGRWCPLSGEYDRFLFNWFGARTTKQYVINSPESDD